MLELVELPLTIGRLFDHHMHCHMGRTRFLHKILVERRPRYLALYAKNFPNVSETMEQSRDIFNRYDVAYVIGKDGTNQNHYFGCDYFTWSAPHVLGDILVEENGLNDDHDIVIKTRPDMMFKYGIEVEPLISYLATNPMSVFLLHHNSRSTTINDPNELFFVTSRRGYRAIYNSIVHHMDTPGTICHDATYSYGSGHRYQRLFWYCAGLELRYIRPGAFTVHWERLSGEIIYVPCQYDSTSQTYLQGTVGEEVVGPPQAPLVDFTKEVLCVKSYASTSLSPHDPTCEKAFPEEPDTILEYRFLNSTAPNSRI